ncbi:unnamed protein product [Microthlaspi erraticum]|uniref:Uncharacterized protein n=1 Tax=Microthlaspi erraticum TaxID=1685480 RepID=A0A6D2K237_9BRAS|nr:unnamed protein product [Microthlaspi erraticum]
MGPPNASSSPETGGLQSQLGADGNPIVHPVEVDATNGHVNPPPPPVPDVEAPVTTAALTAAMQGFAQIAQLPRCKLSSKSTTTRSTPSTSPATDESSRRDELSSRRRQEAPLRPTLMPRRMVRKTPTRKWPSCTATSKQSAPKCTALRDCQNPRRDEKESFHSSHRRDTSKGSNGPPSSVLQQWVTILETG